MTLREKLDVETTKQLKSLFLEGKKEGKLTKEKIDSINFELAVVRFWLSEIDLQKKDGVKRYKKIRNRVLEKISQIIESNQEKELKK